MIYVHEAVRALAVFGCIGLVLFAIRVIGGP